MAYNRKLVTIREIRSIEPIPDADFIELARVDGWQCIVKKGEFKVGDRGVYFEIDSFLPNEDTYAFLNKNCFRDIEGLGSGYRILTLKLKGIRSQGLLLPISSFGFLDGTKAEANQHLQDEFFNQQADLSPYLRVKKFELPIHPALRGQVKGKFPNFISKTGCERIQNVFDTYSQAYFYDDFEATVKLNGASTTIYFNKGDFGICSAEWEMKVDESNKNNSFVQEGLKYRSAIEKLGRNLAFQGEVIGSKINGNRDKYDGQEFFLFDIYDIDNQKYLSAPERNNILYILNFQCRNDDMPSMKNVPVFDSSKKIFQHCTSLEELLEYADGENGLTGQKREGLVFKMISNPEIMFKVISNNYLLKHKD